MFNDRSPVNRVSVKLFRAIFCALIGLVGGSPAVAQEGGKHSFGELGLTLDLSSMPGLKRVERKHSQIVGEFQGKLGASDVEVTLWKFPRKDFRYDEPDQVARFISRPGRKGGFEFKEQEFLDGKYGYVPYAVRGMAGYTQPATKLTGERHYLFGILAADCYQVRVIAVPELDAKSRKSVEQFLKKGVSYSGETRNWKWTDEEAAARWKEHTPKKIHKQLEIRRTKHYIILYNAGGRLFAKKMEEFYTKVQKVFPFPEVKGRRLMPVFLFRINEQYYEYYSRVANKSRASAARSKGHAWRDYYATYYESPNDPVHIHEATHQIFSNRLNLGGGGSWFQEGVADYMSESKNTIKSNVRNQIKSGEYVPFKKFMVIPSLLGSITGSSVRGGSRANNAYLQAASLIYFLRHDKFGKKRFLDFIHAVGKVRRGDLPAIEAAIGSVYQIDIPGLEARWKKYWR